MFGKSFQRKYALTDQGVKNVRQGTLWTVIVNLVVMGGMGISFFQKADKSRFRCAPKVAFVYSLKWLKSYDFSHFYGLSDLTRSAGCRFPEKEPFCSINTYLPLAP